MNNMVIGLKPDAVKNIMSALNKVNDSLRNDSLVKPLTFGVSAPAKASDGDAVDAISLLNTELDVVAKKLAALVEATNLYLDQVIFTFEQADSL